MVITKKKFNNITTTISSIVVGAVLLKCSTQYKDSMLFNSFSIAFDWCVYNSQNLPSKVRQPNQPYYKYTFIIINRMYGMVKQPIEADLARLLLRCMYQADLIVP